ncbi:hypothetical protein V6N12_006026 [Hibiscus sabdariffa]|uniref:Transmembrane protein n=1 Tax=Hibiscus sabdariffa TaxID=183260 RepID=A0ABR2EWS2_9ROSI
MEEGNGVGAAVIVIKLKNASNWCVALTIRRYGRIAFFTFSPLFSVSSPPLLLCVTVCSTWVLIIWWKVIVFAINGVGVSLV